MAYGSLLNGETDCGKLGLVLMGKAMLSKSLILSDKMADYKVVCSSSPVRTPKYNLLLNNHQQENVGSHQKKDNPHLRSKEKTQQDGRRGKVMFRSKLHTHQIR